MDRRYRLQRERMDSVNTIRYEVMVHTQTKVLAREHLPAPYQFVMDKFPEVASIISGINMYKNDNTALWDRLGLSGAAGMYIKPLSLVLIMYSPKAPDDVVAVHELLHCAHDKLNLAEDVFAQETMTFRASIPYIAKTYDDNWIINNYLFPFYMSVYCRKSPMDQARTEAMVKCRQIVMEETGREADLEMLGGGEDRFDFID